MVSVWNEITRRYGYVTEEGRGVGGDRVHHLQDVRVRGRSRICAAVVQDKGIGGRARTRVQERERKGRGGGIKLKGIVTMCSPLECGG